MNALTLAEFALAVIEFRRRFHGSITSWGRTPEHNATVGGVPASFHLDDYAVDLVYELVPELAQAAHAARELGLYLIREATHDHLQPLTQGAPDDGRA